MKRFSLFLTACAMACTATIANAADKVTLQLNEDAVSPILRQFQIRWQCP